MRALVFLCLWLALGLAGTLRAAPPIAARSPFLPPENAAVEKVGPGAAALEFHGFVDVGGGKQFRLFDPAKKRGDWVRLNERSPELEAVIREHNEGEESVSVEHQGRTVSLTMRKSKIVADAAAPAAPPPGVAPAGPAITVTPAVTQTVMVNPSPADEQRRLEAVAAEVNRRRALREQAMRQSAGQPPALDAAGPATPVGPQPPPQLPQVP
ncbi:MAG: hypothetical protein FJ397_12355 [Verrucomicrobia bacterium]|nr:hypothetical protein [Verrucomicrobiota bacterium]